MNPREFYDAVVAMRTVQKRYKERKSHEDYDDYTRLESVIDAEIKRVELILKAQSMFPTLDLVPMKSKIKAEENDT